MKMIENILEIAIFHLKFIIISRTIETILLKLSTIVLHFMRIVYKKFRQVPNFRSRGFPPICFLPNLWRHISNIVSELNIFTEIFSSQKRP